MVSQGALPAPLVGVIVGRDVALVAGAFAIRANSVGWRWPGASEFFRLAPPAEAPPATAGAPGDPAPAAHVIKPLFISKVNTGLQLALVAGCMTDAWLGWPGGEAVWGLGAATAATTVWSCIAYARAYTRGELMLKPPR